MTNINCTVLFQTYTADPNLLWIDVREWVIDTYPWQQSPGVNKLKTLSPEDVGWNHGKLQTVILLSWFIIFICI